MTGPTPARVLRAAARPTPTRDDGLAAAGTRAAGGGDRRSACRLPGVPVPPRLPQPAWAAGRRGWARDNGPGAREQRLWAGVGREPREGAAGAPGPRSARGAGTPPPYGRPGGRRGLSAAGRRASAYLDEELDDRLFVLLLQPIQRHRQRHDRFGCAPWTAAAAAAPAPGLLRLRVPAALRCASLDSPGVELASASPAQHCPTPRARLGGGPSPSHFKPRGGARGRGLVGGVAKALRLGTLEETGRTKLGGCGFGRGRWRSSGSGSGWAGLRATPPEGAGGKFPRGPEPDTASRRGAGASSQQLLLAPCPVTSCLRLAWGGEEAPPALSPRCSPLDSALFRSGHLPNSLC